MSELAKLRERYRHEVELRLPGFTRFTSIGAPEFDAPAIALSDSPRDAGQWYREFSERVLGALGTGAHLPIFRMSHGEYIVMVGYRDPLRHRVRRALSRMLGKQGAFKSGDPLYGWEQYTDEELAEARRRLPGLLRGIAQDGILAIALHPYNPGYSRFLGPALDYLDAHSIELTRGNCFPFYFVYALVLGPDREKLFRGREVLVVTGPTHGKFEKLEKGLARFGAAGVQFLPCHPNKSMLDVLDLGAVRRKVDLVLVGAGVGAANVLSQLKPLGAVCMDVGYCLTVLGEPELPRRAYALPDDEFDTHGLADVPAELAARVRTEAPPTR